MEKLISVIMPAFNSEPYISESIKSILDQNYKNIELIIVDDGSKDNTFEILVEMIVLPSPLMDELTKSDIENFSHLLKELEADIITKTLMVTRKKAEC